MPMSPSYSSYSPSSFSITYIEKILAKNIWKNYNYRKIKNYAQIKSTEKEFHKIHQALLS